MNLLMASRIWYITPMARRTTSNVVSLLAGLGDVKKKDAKKEISEFFVYPNPVKGGKAKARFEIGAPAKTATFELYDITGLCVYKKKMSDLNAGRNQFENLDLKSLGSDVYTARLKVDFEGGNTKQKVFRVGIVH